MKRMIAVLVCVSLAAPGCAVRSLSTATRLSLQRTPAGTSQAIPAEYAQKLPVGSKVKVSLKDGKRFSATFMGVEDEAVRLQKRTRIPEQPFLVPLADLTELSLDEGGGMGVGKAIVTGAGVGAGIFFALVALAAAAWD